MKDDMISRKQAIDVAKNSCFIMRGVRSGRSVTEDAVNATKRIIVDGLHALPPAQLGTNLAEVGTDKNAGTNDDCISRRQAIDAVTDELDMIDHVPQWVFDRLEGRLRQLPPTRPEIVRCKDCKHHWTYKCMDSMPVEKCDLEQTFYDAEHDFCSLAER